MASNVFSLFLWTSFRLLAYGDFLFLSTFFRETDLEYCGRMWDAKILVLFSSLKKITKKSWPQKLKMNETGNRDDSHIQITQLLAFHKKYCIWTDNATTVNFSTDNILDIFRYWPFFISAVFQRILRRGKKANTQCSHKALLNVHFNFSNAHFFPALSTGIGFFGQSSNLNI